MYRKSGSGCYVREENVIILKEVPESVYLSNAEAYCNAAYAAFEREAAEKGWVKME